MTRGTPGTPAVTLSQDNASHSAAAILTDHSSDSECADGSCSDTASIATDAQSDDEEASELDTDALAEADALFDALRSGSMPAFGTTVPASTSTSRSSTAQTQTRSSAPSELLQLGQGAAERQLRAARKVVRRGLRTNWDRLQSIREDALFVSRVAAAWELPLLGNERCGSWYLPFASPPVFDRGPVIGGVDGGSVELASAAAAGRDHEPIQPGRCYFKSTDGHTNNWGFSRRRLNLQVLDVVARDGGAIVVDSTRGGKSMPDALCKTVPIWCCVLNRAVHRWRSGLAAAVQPAQLDDGMMSNQEITSRNNTSGRSVREWTAEDLALHLPRGLVSASERACIEARLDGWVDDFLGCGVDISMIADSLSRPLRPLWVTPASSLPTPLSPQESNRHDGGRHDDDDSASPSADDDRVPSYAYPEWDFSPIVCCTASRAVRDGIQRVRGYTYVQGAADDEESWSRGLTPALFRANIGTLLPTHSRGAAEHRPGHGDEEGHAVGGQDDAEQIDARIDAVVRAERDRLAAMLRNAQLADSGGLSSDRSARIVATRIEHTDVYLADRASMPTMLREFAMVLDLSADAPLHDEPDEEHNTAIDRRGSYRYVQLPASAMKRDAGTITAIYRLAEAAVDSVWQKVAGEDIASSGERSSRQSAVLIVDEEGCRTKAAAVGILLLARWYTSNSAFTADNDDDDDEHDACRRVRREVFDKPTVQRCVTRLVNAATASSGTELTDGAIRQALRCDPARAWLRALNAHLMDRRP